MVDDLFVLRKEQDSRHQRVDPILLHQVVLPVAIGVDTKAIVELLLCEKVWVEIVNQAHRVSNVAIKHQSVVGDGAALDVVHPRGLPQFMRGDVLEIGHYRDQVCTFHRGHVHANIGLVKFIKQPREVHFDD